MPRKHSNPTPHSSGERQDRSRLHQLLVQADGLLHGSLVEMARRCGNPRCRCAKSDEHKHRSLYLAQTRHGKSSMVYIPKNFEKTARLWVDNYQQASDLLESITQHGRSRLDENKIKNRTAKKKAAKKKLASKKISGHRTAKKKTTTNPPKPS